MLLFSRTNHGQSYRHATVSIEQRQHRVGMKLRGSVFRLAASDFGFAFFNHAVIRNDDPISGNFSGFSSQFLPQLRRGLSHHCLIDFSLHWLGDGFLSVIFSLEDHPPTSRSLLLKISHFVIY